MRDDEHAIAGVDTLRQPPQLPDGRPAAARVAVVLDIIVYERKIVDELEASRQRKRLVWIAAGSTAGQQSQLGAQQLAGINIGRPQLRIAPSELIVLHGIVALDTRLGGWEGRAHCRLNRYASFSVIHRLSR